MDYGLGLLNYDGCWDDVAFAEEHGFHTAGFVESPLLAGDPFVCLGLTAKATSKIRIGTFLSIPGLRDATTLAAGAATLNHLAPGRVFLAIGTGYTARDTFGLRPVSAERVRDVATTVRGLLNGEEVSHTIGQATRKIRFRHEVRNGGVNTADHVPIWIAGDGPKALRAAGEAGEGLIVTLKNASAMGNAPEVLRTAVEQVSSIATENGRSFDDGYVMWSTAICVLEPGESAVSPRALDHVGAACMMAFHSYACHPEIADYLPPPIRDRIDIYRRDVLSRWPENKIYQEVHAGHLAHMLEGEAGVLTEDVVRMTSLTGTAEEIVSQLRALEDNGLKNITFWVPPHLTRSVVLDVEQKIMPVMRQTAVT